MTRPKSTYEALLRLSAAAWGLVSTAASDIAERCELRELDRLTDAEEVRHAVLCGMKEETE